MPRMLSVTYVSYVYGNEANDLFADEDDLAVIRAAAVRRGVADAELFEKPFTWLRWPIGPGTSRSSPTPTLPGTGQGEFAPVMSCRPPGLRRPKPTSGRRTRLRDCRRGGHAWASGCARRDPSRRRALGPYCDEPQRWSSRQCCSARSIMWSAGSSVVMPRTRRSMTSGAGCGRVVPCYPR